jgi:hypothetical protein
MQTYVMTNMTVISSENDETPTIPSAPEGWRSFDQYDLSPAPIVFASSIRDECNVEGILFHRDHLWLVCRDL